MNQDMEMFCDERTLRLATAPQRKAYAKTLLSFAEQQSSLRAGPAFGESNTERRVKNIMQKKKKNFLVFGMVVLLAIFCTTAFMTVPKAAKNEDKTQNIGSDNDNTGANTSPTPFVEAGESLPADASQDLVNHIVFKTDPTISSLQYFSFSIPDFKGQQEMDAAFWKKCLFDTFKNAGYGEPAKEYVIESLPLYSEQLGFDIPYYKVMSYDLDRLTRELFGTTLSELGLAPESLADGTRIIFEDGVYGVYYFAASSFSELFVYGLPLEESAPDGITKLVFPKYQVEEEWPVDEPLLLSQITLYLQPAEDESGYIIVGKEEQMAKDIKNEDLVPQILDSDICRLQQAAIFMRDFTEETELDAAFFQDYLFHSSDQLSGGEKVNRYSKHRDMTTAYLKIDTETLDRKIMEIFGNPLSSYVKNPQDLTDEYGDILFEDGCYYIRIPHSGAYIFDKTELNVAGDRKSAELSFLKRSASSSYPSSKIMLYLKEDENGYILTGKKEIEYDFTFRTLTGTWLVTDYFIPPHAQNSDLSQENIEAFIGTLLRFGPDYLRVGSRTYPVSEYQKEQVTAEEFDALFRLSSGEELSVSSDRFDYYRLQTEGEQPFGTYVYRYDFEKALVVYEGVIYRINWLTDVMDKETNFDESADFVFALPDENGFVNGPIISYLMMPGSILYYTDDTHYIIVEGGIEMDTPQKVEEYNAATKANGIDIIRRGAKTDLAVNRPSDGMILTYDMYGRLMHIYPHDYPREKLAEGFLNWCCENEFCRAVAAGLDGTQPRVYYKASGNNWDIYPLPGLENLTDEERDSLVLEADEQKIRITVIKDGEKIVREIEVNQ